MTHGKDGFSLAHRAALMIGSVRRALAAMVATFAVIAIASTGYALDNATVIEADQGAGLVGLNGSINTYPVSPNKSIKPSSQIQEANINFFGAAVPAEDTLTGVAINPTTANGLNPGAIYTLSNLSFLGGPDVLAGFTAGSNGSPTAAVGLITFSETLPDGTVVPIIQLAAPQALTFATAASGAGTPEAVAVGDFFVSNLLGGEGAGSVAHFPGDAGTGSNPLGLIVNPFGADPPEIPSLVLQDSVLSASNPFGCPMGVSTDLFFPVGVGLDSANNIYVANSGHLLLAGIGSPGFITVYPPGSFGCTPPTGLIGAGLLNTPTYLAVDSADHIWVTDTGLNAIFGFSPAGALIAEIRGKKTQLKSPMGIAAIDTVDGLELIVANNGKGNILEFEPALNGTVQNIKPVERIQGKKTKLILPVGIAAIPATP
jgi:hypothetical protein